MIDPKFKIGDIVWMAEGIHTQGWVKCPDCLGECALTVILADGSKVSIDCECCRFIEVRHPGYIHEYGCYQYQSVSRRITGMECRAGRWVYHVDEKSSDIEESDLKSSMEEVAEIVKRLDANAEEEAYRQFWMGKENAKQKWAWNVHYHRREMKDAARRLAYHTDKLAVAKQKVKDPELVKP